jgi:DNA-binding NarL/FixJ family response regulator/anti-sigma regulatory factor (Ser/Thr protein kinase)
VEWAFDGGNTAAVTALRREIAAYIRRHADEASDVAGAELIVAELVANAAEHAPGPAWVRLLWGDDRARLEVHDLGPGFVMPHGLPEPATSRGRGLFIAAAIAGDLERADKRSGGSKVVATLPVRRSTPQPATQPTARVSSLPAVEAAGSDGTFARDVFLRALIVELAHAVDEQQGPDAAAAAVTQVGAHVGGQMEAAYRTARAVVGRLSPHQMAELFIRLKRAIDGDFYLITADDEKIVLGNRRCPFGATIRREPLLCHMTSSAFGGIAAHNYERSAVVLEERIALGDPECRVIVWLDGHEPPDIDAHRFVDAAPATAPEPDLVNACRAAMRGQPYLYAAAVVALLRDFLRHGEYVGAPPTDPLTRRERQVLTLIAGSHTGREIADTLGISEKTVARHRANILLKLGLRDRVALTRYAIRRGLIEP